MPIALANYTCHYLQNSATQRLSMDIADIGGNNEVLLYWVSPAEQADAATVVFWSVNQCMYTLTDISSCAGPPILYLLPIHCMQY